MIHERMEGHALARGEGGGSFSSATKLGIQARWALAASKRNLITSAVNPARCSNGSSGKRTRAATAISRFKFTPYLPMRVESLCSLCFNDDEIASASPSTQDSSAPCVTTRLNLGPRSTVTMRGVFGESVAETFNFIQCK